MTETRPKTYEFRHQTSYNPVLDSFGLPIIRKPPEVPEEGIPGG
jgi:hypothetical protein